MADNSTPQNGVPPGGSSPGTASGSSPGTASGSSQPNGTGSSAGSAGSQGASPALPDPGTKSNEAQGYTGVIMFTGVITLLMYFQLVGFYKFFHKRHPRIFKKPKLPPFEVMRERVLNSKIAKKLKGLGSQPEGGQGQPAANQAAANLGRVNQGFMDEDDKELYNMDEDNQRRSVSSRASTGPRLRTARRANWSDRARRVNRQMRANDAE